MISVNATVVNGEAAWGPDVHNEHILYAGNAPSVVTVVGRVSKVQLRKDRGRLPDAVQISITPIFRDDFVRVDTLLSTFAQPQLGEYADNLLNSKSPNS